MNPKRKAALLWGVIGALAFLVFLQGYLLVSDRWVDPFLAVGVALVVGLVAAVATGLLQGRLRAQT
ncbi:MAG: hypothetical protein ABEI57_00060 [Halapricum sp.]